MIQHPPPLMPNMPDHLSLQCVVFNISWVAFSSSGVFVGLIYYCELCISSFYNCKMEEAPRKKGLFWVVHKLAWYFWFVMFNLFCTHHKLMYYDLCQVKVVHFKKEHKIRRYESQSQGKEEVAGQIPSCFFFSSLPQFMLEVQKRVINISVFMGGELIYQK